MTSTRSGVRHKRRFRVTIGTAPVFTLDLGPGGFSAEIMRAVPIGSTVKGTIRLNGVDVPYAGQIVWAKPGDPRLNLRSRLGIRFTNLPPEVTRLISSPAFNQVV
jgi:hypothetical protein